MKFKTFRKMALLGCAASALLGGSVMAQDEGVGVVQVEMTSDDGSGSGPIVISSSSMSFADSDGNFQLFSGDGMGADGFMPSSMNPLSLLDNDEVRADLDLVGDQLDKFKEAQEAVKAQIAAKAKELSSGKLDPASMGAIAREMAQLKRAGQQQMESLLLPHQLDRLKEVALQMQMQKRGPAKTILSPEIAEALGIDSDQKKRILEREKELKKELEEKMTKLKEEMREKLMSELTSEQKTKLETLSGRKFDYKPVSMKDRIRKQIEKRMKRKDDQPSGF